MVVSVELNTRLYQIQSFGGIKCGPKLEKAQPHVPKSFPLEHHDASTNTPGRKLPL